MADDALSQKHLSIHTPMALIAEMLDAEKWSWVAALVLQSSESLDPQALLEQVCLHGAGGEMADRLMCQALKMGANPDCQMVGSTGETGYPLAWAALSGRPLTLARLLNDPQASRWVAAPVGQWPLAHQLLAHSNHQAYQQLRAVGMSEGAAADGSMPWERAPLHPGWNNQPTRQMLELETLGVLPINEDELRIGLDRLFSRASRQQTVDLQAWAETLRTHLKMTANPEIIRKDMAGIWIQVAPAKKYQDVKVLPAAFDYVDQAPVSEWLIPMTLDNLGARSGNWTLAAAAAWALVLQGPHMDNSSKKDLAHFELWSRLPSLDQDPALQAIWSAPVFTGNGGTVTLEGLAALSKMEHIHTVFVRREGAVNIDPWVGDLGLPQVSAALRTLLAIAPHLGAHRREKMRAFMPELLLLSASSNVAQWKAITEKVKIHSVGERLHMALTLNRANFNLLAGASPANMDEFGEMLETLSEEEEAKLTKADWKMVRNLLIEHPQPLFKNQMVTTNLKDKGRLGPVLVNAPPFLLAPLDHPKAMVNERLLQGVDTMNRLCINFTSSNESDWRLMLNNLRSQLPGQVFSTPTSAAHDFPPLNEENNKALLPSHADQIQWICAIGHRFPKRTLGEETLSDLWRHARAMSKAQKKLSPSVAAACKEMFEPSRECETWVKIWNEALLSKQDDAHPIVWLKQIGVALPPEWSQSLIKVARGLNGVSGLEQMEALDRAYRTPDLPASPSARRMRKRT